MLLYDKNIMFASFLIYCIYFSGDVMNNGIQVIYPRTTYKVLNEAISQFIEKTILEFINIAKEPIQENFTYTLDISHDEYHYQDYLSIVFYVSSYTGGAHPNHSIFSLVYDISTDKIITMEDLVEEREELLSILSLESRKILSQNPKVVDSTMLMKGTLPSISNFSIFALGPGGIILFFPEYQVAPYSSGAFKVVVNYNTIFEHDGEA